MQVRILSATPRPRSINWIERWIAGPKVAGSSPAGGAIFK